MATIVLRSAGAQLKNNTIDTNFTNLNDDKMEKVADSNLTADTADLYNIGNGTTRFSTIYINNVNASVSLSADTLAISAGSITDSSGAITFGNENLSTTGTLASGALTVTGAATVSTTLGVTELITADEGINIGADGVFASGSIYGGSIIGLGIGARSGSTFDFAILNPIGSTLFAIPASSNNVYVTNSLGIGLTAPQAKIHILDSSSGANTTPLILHNDTLAADSAVSIRFAPTTAETVRYAEIGGINNGSNSIDLIFKPGAGATIEERMRLTASGDLGLSNSSTYSVGALQGGAVLSGSTILHVYDDTTSARLTVEGTAGAVLDMVDAGGASNDKWIYALADAGVLKWRSLNDSGSTRQDNILVMDMGTGNVGINIAVPDGRLHILKSTTSGAVTANVNGNVCVLEDSISNGLSILTPDGSSSFIMYGSPGSNRGAESSWSYSTSTFNITTRKTGAQLTLGAGNGGEVMRLQSSANVSIGTTTDGGQLRVEQSGTTAAEPVLYLDQKDLDQDFIDFRCTVGTGNALELVAAKTLTTTHFIKISINGSVRYIPAGTIA